MSSLLEHWRELHSSVHPKDEKVLSSYRHSFNIDYPPPAFIGDIERAPVLLLNANGGFNPKVTPGEFAGPSAREDFIARLKNPSPPSEDWLAPYYKERNYAEHLIDGNLAIVNAVAYRSRFISREPNNRRLAEMLPSTAIHRNWLRREILPEAAVGHRLVIGHRTSLWSIKRNRDQQPGLRFTTNPVSKDLTKDCLAAIDWFLEQLP